MLTANFISQHLLYVHPLQQQKYNRANFFYKAVNKSEQYQKAKQLKHKVFKSSARQHMHPNSCTTGLKQQSKHFHAITHVHPENIHALILIAYTLVINITPLNLHSSMAFTSISPSCVVCRDEDYCIVDILTLSSLSLIHI